MPFKDFDAEEDEVSGEPIEFKLSGRKFRVVQPAPIGGLVLVARAMGDTDVSQMQAIDRLFRRFLPTDQHTDWDESLGELTNLGKLEQVVEYIITEATKRPT